MPRALHALSRPPRAEGAAGRPPRKEGPMIRAFVALCLALAAAPAVAQTPGCDPGEEEWKFSLVTAVQGHPKGEAALAFADAVNRRFEGRYCVGVYGNAELFNDEDVFDAMKRGEAHFAAPSFVQFASFSPKFGIVDLPFLFDGPLQADQFFASEWGQQMMGEIEDDGFVSLGFWSNGMRHFSANTPLRDMSDAAGLKFRLQNESDINRRMFELMGADYEVIPFAKVFEQLESGALDGQENTWSNMYGNRFYEVQQYITETNHWYLGYGVVAAKDFIEGLDEETRTFVIDTMKLISHERNRFAFEINEQQRFDIIEDGGTIITLTPEELETWRAALLPLIEEFKPLIGEDFVNAAIEFNANADPFD